MFVDILKPGLTLTLTCLELIAIQPVSVSSPRQVRQYVKNSSRENSNRKGGLIFTASIYPDVPLKNVEALCQAFEEYMWLKSPVKQIFRGLYLQNDARKPPASAGG